MADALQEENPQQIRKLLAEWWTLRSERRQKLSADLIKYEKEREWLEGTAKYAELQIWLTAAKTVAYTTMESMKKISDFSEYTEAKSHWENEVNQLGNGNKISDSMFYYTGWAQAELLDRLYKEWKDKVFDDEVYLEDLLAQVKTLSS